MKRHAVARTDLGVPVPRGGDAEGVGLGNRFAQQVDQRVVDTGVFDASGSEQKFHDSSPCRFHMSCKATFALTFSSGSII